MARPKHMVRDVAARLAWGMVVLVLAGLNVFLVYALIQWEDGTARRDFVLVLLGTMLATFVSVVISGIGWEIRERTKFRQMNHAYASERAGNVIRLELNRNYSGSATVNGRTKLFQIPLYQLATTALRTIVEADVLARERIAELHAELLRIDEFNRLARIAESWFAQTIGAIDPVLPMINGLQTVCDTLAERRASLLRDSSSAAQHIVPPDDGATRCG